MRITESAARSRRHRAGRVAAPRRAAGAATRTARRPTDTGTDARQRSVRALTPRWRRGRWTGRAGGRRYRAVRRALAVLLLVLAGISAARGDVVAAGVDTLTLTRDLEVGAVLTAADVAVARIVAPPDGALVDPAAVDGRRLTSAARRGEVLTDRRLVDTPGPDPGPGRAAVAVRPADPAVLQLLQAGSAVVVVGIGADGAVLPLTSEALVLVVLAAEGAPGEPSRPVLLSVPEDDADRLAAAALTGDIALRLR